MGGNADLKQKDIIMTFITPNDNCPLSHSDQNVVVAKGLQEHKITQNGELLGTMECRAMFPMVHFSRTWLEDGEIELLGPNDLAGGFLLQQGIYKECKSYDVVNRSMTSAARAEKAYIFLGYNSLENNVSNYLVNTWINWSGVKVIHAGLRKEVSVHRYVFFHRSSPADVKLFMYVLLVECGNVTKTNEMFLLDFVQRMRVERGFGYLTAYKTTVLATPSTIIHGILLDKDEYEEKVDI